MKILQITHNFYPVVGGIENYVLELCRHLKQHNVQSDVLCLNKHPASKKELPKLDSFEGIKIFRSGFLDLKYYKLAPDVLRFVNGYDLLHVHNIGFFSDFLAFTRLIHGKKLVISTHGGFFHTGKLSAIKKTYFHTLNALALSAADAVICDSRHDFELFSKISRKAVLVNNGVSVEKFLKLKGKREKDSLLFVGRFSKNKRIEDLLSVAALLKNKGIKFKLQILGSDFEGLLPKFKKIVKDQELHECVEIVLDASDSELRKAYSKAEFFVSASAYEGFGISAIEAMAAGCIPILNNIDSFNQFVKDGKNGFILDFAKPEKAAERIAGIIRLKKSQKKKISDLARQKAKEFDWRKVVEKVVKVYKSVLNWV